MIADGPSRAVESHADVYALDDDPVALELVEGRARKLGFTFRGFRTVDQLAAAVTAAEPKLITLDLNLGKDPASGFELIERLRGPLAYLNPILVFSDDGEYARVAHAIELGANDYVLKSAPAETFFARVRECLDPDAAPEKAVDGFPFGEDGDVNSRDEAYRSVRDSVPAVRLGFTIRFLEVRPLGFAFWSPHLLKKGTSLTLRGKDLKEILPAIDAVFATVVGNEAYEGPERGYKIRVSIDASNDRAAEGITRFLRAAKGAKT